MTTDVVLNRSDEGYYDISWTASGDIETEETLDTYILMCLFEEVRATFSEVPEANRRRGWLGNEVTPDFQQGSKMWLFEQERVTGTMLAELGVVIRNGLQPLIDDGIAVNVLVETPLLKNGVVSVYINLYRDGSRIDRLFYELWDNTGNF
jgi:phage gp46-like protein